MSKEFDFCSVFVSSEKRPDALVHLSGLGDTEPPCKLSGFHAVDSSVDSLPVRHRLIQQLDCSSPSGVDDPVDTELSMVH